MSASRTAPLSSPTTSPPLAAARPTDAGWTYARDIVRLHCDPVVGAPYWIETARRLGIDAERDLQSREDLQRFGWMDEEALRTRPVTDFIPASVRRESTEFILCETSGFLGTPKATAFTPAEFGSAFLRPFIEMAEHAGFPVAGRWLFIGPGGPHPIGRAAVALARRLSGFDPHTLDFDPRWFGRLEAGGFARERYLEHLLRQAETLLRREPIEILFATPAVLERLADRMTEGERERIRGIHYGGQPVTPQRREKLEGGAFPHAAHLAGYGNSLFGVCLEWKGGAGPTPRYFPRGDRLRLRVVRTGEPREAAPLDCPLVPYGERGRVCFDRFDRTTMILNMRERDEAVRIAPPVGGAALGLRSDGVAAPDLAPALRAHKVEGIY